jgi:hypothetical protein
MKNDANQQALPRAVFKHIDRNQLLEVRNGSQFSTKQKVTIHQSEMGPDSQAQQEQGMKRQLLTSPCGGE